jgi:hypothetical protein
MCKVQLSQWQSCDDFPASLPSAMGEMLSLLSAMR